MGGFNWGRTGLASWVGEGEGGSYYLLYLLFVIVAFLVKIPYFSCSRSNELMIGHFEY